MDSKQLEQVLRRLLELERKDSERRTRHAAAMRKWRAKERKRRTRRGDEGTR